MIDASKIGIDQKNKLIHLSGSLIPLLLSLTFFVIKYFIGVTFALYPTSKKIVFFFLLDITTSGIITGISLGRLGGILKVYKLKLLK